MLIYNILQPFSISIIKNCFCSQKGSLFKIASIGEQWMESILTCGLSGGEIHIAVNLLTGKEPAIPTELTPELM
jgi:hypothetical protein